MNAGRLTIFPKIVSLTLTHACNLRCKMCGQWKSKVRNYAASRGTHSLSLGVWKKVVREVASHKGTVLLIRGGEPFLYPGIIDLLAYVKKNNIFVSIDTNGMLLEKYADDIVRLGVDHLTVSVDGPQKNHDRVRGVPGSFEKIRSGLDALRRAEGRCPATISKTICFVISPYSYLGLGCMPDVARQLHVPRIAIVPYVYLNRKRGEEYEALMREEFGCRARSWKGFHREVSGIGMSAFLKSFRSFKRVLKNVVRDPFMDFSEKDYRMWFTNCSVRPKRHACRNPELLADIQPNGDVNFCVDFPDYSIGNVRDTTLGEIWKSEKAKRFRAYVAKRSLPLCFRCTARYISG